MHSQERHQAIFQGIDGSENWMLVTPIPGGDVSECRYHIQTKNGFDLFLQTRPPACYDRIRQAYPFLKDLAGKSGTAPRPRAYGLSHGQEFCYLLSDWVYGEPADHVLTRCGNHEQYILGVDFGFCLRRIHAASDARSSQRYPGPPPLISARQQDLQLRRLMDRARAQAAKFPAVSCLCEFISRHQNQLSDQSSCFLHGNARPEQALLRPLHGLVMTDFSHWHYGHPLQELAGVLIDNRCKSPAFVTGLLDSYLFGLNAGSSLLTLTVQVAGELLRRLADAAGNPDLQASVQATSGQFILDYDHFRQLIPLWYKPLPRIPPAN